MTEYAKEIKDAMRAAAASGEWSQINPLLEHHGNGLAIADLNGCSATALHYLTRDAPDVPASAESIQHLTAIDNVNVDVHAVDVTPLLVASWWGKVHHVRALLRCGAIADPRGFFNQFKYLKANNNKIISSLLKNPPRTYKQELIDKRNLLAMILNKLISLGTKQDINQMLISIGY